MSSSNTQNSETPTEPTLFVDGANVIHEMQDIVGRKWHPVLIYRLLENGPMGFSTLKGQINGISSKMLSETLTDLQEAGLVDRTQLTDQPVRVEYTLTDRGRSLESVITEMVRWGSQYGIEGTDGNHEQRTVVGGEQR